MFSKILSNPEFDHLEEEAWRADEDAWCDQDPSVYYRFADANARAKSLAIDGMKVVLRRAEGGWKVHAS